MYVYWRNSQANTLMSNFSRYEETRSPSGQHTYSIAVWNRVGAKRKTEWEKKTKIRSNEEIVKTGWIILNTFCIALYTCDCEYFDIFEWWCYLSIRWDRLQSVCVCLRRQHLRPASTRTLPNRRFAIPKSVVHERSRISSETYKSHWRCSFFFSVRLLVCDGHGTPKSKIETENNTETCLLHGGLWRLSCTQCHAQKWPERRRCYYRSALIIFTFYVRVTVYDEYLFRKWPQWHIRPVCGGKC